MYNSVNEVPTGILVMVNTGLLRCKCGVTVFGARYEARATDEYTTQVDGKLRRRFNFEGDNPFCNNCDNHIWLADDNSPFAANGWPIRKEEDAPLLREKEEAALLKKHQAFQ